MFSGCVSVRAHIRAYELAGCIPKSLLPWYPENQWTEFHQTLVYGVVEAIDKLNRFWRSRVQGQGQHKVRCKKTSGPHIWCDGFWPNLTQTFYTMNWLSFEGRGVKVKVATRSNIWLSHCSRRRHPHKCLASKYHLALQAFCNINCKCNHGITVLKLT